MKDFQHFIYIIVTPLLQIRISSKLSSYPEIFSSFLAPDPLFASLSLLQNIVVFGYLVFNLKNLIKTIPINAILWPECFALF